MPTKSCFLLFLEFVGGRYLLIKMAGWNRIFGTVFITAEIHVSPLSFHWHITPAQKTQTDGVIQRRFLRLLSGTEKEVHKGFDCNVGTLVMFS